MSNTLLLGMGLLVSTAVFGQATYLQDSIYIDRGEEQTTQFSPHSRVYFTEYSASNQPTEIIVARPAAGTWTLHRRRLLTYDAEDRLSQLRIQEWSTDQEKWLDFSERGFIYTNTGRLAGLTFRQAPGPDLPLENRRRKMYSYTAGGDEAEVQAQKWNNGAWENIWRSTSDYTAAGDRASQLLQQWKGDAWVNRLQRLWTYADPSGQNTEIVTQEWSMPQAQWVNLRRRGLTYNAKGFWIGSLYQRWNADQEAWENTSREIHQLNNNNTLDDFVFQAWLNGEWVNASREVAYHSELNFGTVVQRWDESANQWENRFRYQTTLDNDALLREVLDRQVWNRDEEAWRNAAKTERQTYFWSATTVSTEAPAYPTLDCLFPNPYGPGATIRCDELAAGDHQLELYDLAGRQLFSQPLLAGQALALPATLPSGTYVLQIRQGRLLRMAEKIVVVH